jgi:hypothetical protein
MEKGKKSCGKKNKNTYQEAGFTLPNQSLEPPTLGIGIPSGTVGIPPNTAQIQKNKMKRLYNRFGVYRPV